MTSFLRVLVVWFGMGGCWLIAQDSPARVTGAPQPSYFGIEGGRFAVIASPGADGRALFDLAESAWRFWRVPLELPDRWPVGITVRLDAKHEGEGRVVMETTGLTTVWLGDNGKPGPIRDLSWLRSLSEGIWLRKFHGQGWQGRPPRWLYEASAQAVWVSSYPAMLDAWQHTLLENGGGDSLREVLFWEGRSPDEARGAAALALWQWLRAEGDEKRWFRFIQSIGRGGSPGAALAAEYGDFVAMPGDAREWEMTWQVVTTRLARARQGPMEAAERSRERIAALSRIAVRDVVFDRDLVLAAGGDWSTRDESWLRVERARRSTLLAAELGRTHVFWLNAAISLGRLWETFNQGKSERWREAEGLWREDFGVALELQRAARTLLHERKVPPP